MQRKPFMQFLDSCLSLLSFFFILFASNGNYSSERIQIRDNTYLSFFGQYQGLLSINKQTNKNKSCIFLYFLHEDVFNVRFLKRIRLQGRGLKRSLLSGWENPFTDTLRDTGAELRDTWAELREPGRKWGGGLKEFNLYIKCRLHLRNHQTP